MALNMGMDPEKVDEVIQRLQASIALIDNAAAGARQAAWESLNPLSYGLMPGALILAPPAILSTQMAAAQLTAAARDAEMLLSRLRGEVASQRQTSQAGTASFTSRDLTPADIDKMSPVDLLRIANTQGLPAAIKSLAAERFLAFARDNPEEAYELMGFDAANKDHISLETFKEQLAAIHEGFEKAKKDADRIMGSPAVQLVTLGNHDGVLTAAISLGDLDTASNVAVNVSGMNSNVGEIENGNQAAWELYKNAQMENSKASYAVVNWLGYRPPTLSAGDVWGMERAESGATELASFIDGIAVSRERIGNPIDKFVVAAHSYGSTTAVEGLKQTEYEVDVLITYGSAGVKNGTRFEDINAKEMYSTEAKGDNIAQWGYAGEKNTDPRDIEGVQTFSSEKIEVRGNVLKRTTMHSMYVEEDKWSWGNMWAGTVGYLSPGSSASQAMGSILAGQGTGQ